LALLYVEGEIIHRSEFTEPFSESAD